MQSTSRSFSIGHVKVFIEDRENSWLCHFCDIRNGEPLGYPRLVPGESLRTAMDSATGHARMLAAAIE